MIRLLFVLTISILTFLQCTTTKKPEKEVQTEKMAQKPDKPQETTPEPTTEEQPYTRPEGKSYTEAGKNQPSNNVLEFFATDYWLPQFAISSQTAKAHLPYQGMWLKFNKDGKFIGGIDKKQNIVGSWKYETKNNMLFILSTNKDLEGKWKVNRAGFEMVWLARDLQEIQDIQIKFVNSSSKPGEE